MEQARKKYQLSERRACFLLSQHRSTQRYAPRQSAFNERLTRRTIELACRYGRYGYRRIEQLLAREGWHVNHKRIERIWKQEGLKVPAKQPKRGRLWFNDGSCIRLKPLFKHHVWSYDFVADRTHDGRPLRILTLIDEYSRECLMLRVRRQFKAQDVIEVLAEQFLKKGPPAHLRSDNGPEFTARAVRQWLEKFHVKNLFIEPGSPWENGYVESFNGRMRDELLNLERFDTLDETKVLVERWRHVYNRIRPHSSLGYRPPAPETKEPWPPGFAPLRLSSMVPELS